MVGSSKLRRAGDVELAALGVRAHCSRLQRSCTPPEFRFQIANCVFLKPALWRFVSKPVYVCLTWKETPHLASSTVLQKWRCYRRTTWWWDTGATTWPRTAALHRVPAPHNCRSLGVGRIPRFLQRKSGTGISSRASLPSIPGTRQRSRL